jgi:hypothetical protein
MRNPLLAAMLIAFGTTVAMPAMAAVDIERYAFQEPHLQKGDTLALLGSQKAGKPVITGNALTTGIAGTTKEAAPSKPPPSETNGALAAKDRLMMDSTAGTGPG